MSSLGDIARPTSRVLRPPGGGSSNIFGETDNSSTKKSPNAKPTYQSSVFSSGLEPEKPKSATRPDRMSSNIFGTDNNDNQTSTNAKKVSKTHQSSLFQEPEPLSEEKKKEGSRSDPITGGILGHNQPNQEQIPKGSRSDTITGGILGHDQPNQEQIPKGNSGAKANEEKKTSDPAADVKNVKNLNPHLGPVINTSGVRCAQPPGGKSSISFS
uniref:jupiter microtubule associated homolog 2-like isoform X3 n=1 Tax=Styela clava TaxID=7725 RepID=UPI00193A3267|nr:jupiter microtubule associated homolog 2-like isoform X3 [Styela clava]